MDDDSKERRAQRLLVMGAVAVILACLPIAFTMEGFVAEVAGYVALFSPFDVFMFSMLILHRRPVPQALLRALTATLIFIAIGVVLILSIRWLSLHGAG